jgi:hypothetical protein
MQLPFIDDMHKMDGMAITELDGDPRKALPFFLSPALLCAQLANRLCPC